MTELMEAMGADIVETPEISDQWSHQQGFGESGGGVIIGDDPEISAVNNYLQSWDMDNLFVIGVITSKLFINKVRNP